MDVFLACFLEFLAVIAQAVKTGRKAMHGSQHVLNHFLVWRELLVVEYKLSRKLGAASISSG
jgi:hypothetical protein